MIVLDIEASGTEYHKHSIVSLGALDLKDPDNRIYIECRIWEGAHIMDEALKVNGFTKEEITSNDKMTEEELIRNFFGWAMEIEDRTLAGQNVSFDRDFTKAAAERAHMDWPLSYRTIDTHTLAYMHYVKAGKNIPFAKNHSAINLDVVLNYVGIPEEPSPHNALTGALCHAEVVSRLMYDEKLLPEFEEFDIPWKK